MSTAQTIINRALRLIEQIDAGESPTTDETSDGLIALNAMVESWRNDKLMCYAMREETLTLSNSDGSYTIGPSGDLNTTRPIAIEAAWIEDSNERYHCRILTEDEWRSEVHDATEESDWPNKVLYRPTMATGTLLVHPEPNATRTMKLLTRFPVTEFASAATSISLPPGWEEALAFNLAITIATEYHVKPSEAVIAIASKSLAGIKRTNSSPGRMTSDLSAMFGSTGGNILSDAA